MGKREAGTTAFVAPMMRRQLAEVQAKQDATWTEYHSHCGHGPADSVACDHTEAYCTDAAEVAAMVQREVWRHSEPRVRADSTRMVRDHHFAIEIDKAKG
jgi:hypothetical protein